MEYILPSPKGLRGKWDKNVKESEVIEHINKVRARPQGEGLTSELDGFSLTVECRLGGPDAFLNGSYFD